MICIQLAFKTHKGSCIVLYSFFFFCFFLGEKKSFLKDVKISANWQEHNLSIGSMKASNLQSNWDGYKDWINTTWREAFK